MFCGDITDNTCRKWIPKSWCCICDSPRSNVNFSWLYSLFHSVFQSRWRWSRGCLPHRPTTSTTSTLTSATWKVSVGQVHASAGLTSSSSSSVVPRTQHCTSTRAARRHSLSSLRNTSSLRSKWHWHGRKQTYFGSLEQLVKNATDHFWHTSGYGWINRW